MKIIAVEAILSVSLINFQKSDNVAIAEIAKSSKMVREK